jgi:hypothetical protein
MVMLLAMMMPVRMPTPVAQETRPALWECRVAESQVVVLTGGGAETVL